VVRSASLDFCDNMSDGCIMNCNNLLRIRDEMQQAGKVWDVGMKLKVSSKGKNDFLMGKLVHYVERDQMEAIRATHRFEEGFTRFDQ